MLLVCSGLTACPAPQASDDEASSDSKETQDPSTDTSESDDGPMIICVPGETRCLDAATLETCTATGLNWTPSPCDTHQTCESCASEDPDGECIAGCAGDCEKLEGLPSSEGCSFFATSMFQADQNDSIPDAIVVGNPDPSRVATIERYFVPYGSNIEELVEGPIELMPNESYVFLLPAELTEYLGNTSLYRSGVVHHVVSDLPIVAYLHSPYEATSTNGSSMLLPEHVMTGNYVVYGEAGYTNPSYFSVIALENQTTVRWSPRFPTAGNALPLPFVDAGGMGEQLLNRFDNIRIDSSILGDPPSCLRDLSGTVIEADKPIWVVSAVRGARVPFCAPTELVPGCGDHLIDPKCASASDFLQEQNLPLEYWGKEYVGPHSPLRGNEDHYWRIYSGDDDVTVTVDPPQAGTPIQLAKRGDWAPLVVPSGTNLVFTANGPFMPVQYAAGDYVANNIGSPAMVQMIPTAQFLDNYVFVTGFSYDFNYVQVIRELGTAEVVLDGVAVTGWEPVAGWEVATVEIDEGAHAIESGASFGIVQYGFTVDADDPRSAGYGYPGGMKAEVIFIP